MPIEDAHAAGFVLLDLKQGRQRPRQGSTVEEGGAVGREIKVRRGAMDGDVRPSWDVLQRSGLDRVGVGSPPPICMSLCLPPVLGHPLCPEDAFPLSKLPSLPAALLPVPQLADFGGAALMDADGCACVQGPTVGMAGFQAPEAHKRGNQVGPQGGSEGRCHPPGGEWGQGGANTSQLGKPFLLASQ